MFVTWLMMTGIFFVISVVSQLLIKKFRFRSLLLMAAGALLYVSVRHIFNFHITALAAKEAALFNPLLLGICCLLLTISPSYTSSKYKLTHFDSWLPLLIFIIFYTLFNFLSQSFIETIYWLLGGIFIWYTSRRYRTVWYGILLSSIALFSLLLKATVILHGMLTGIITIVIAVLLSYTSKKHTTTMLYKQLGCAGLCFIAASKIMPLGGAWILNFIINPFEKDERTKNLLTTIEDIGFCTLGWLIVPLVFIPGFSSMHVLELLLNMVVLGTAFIAIYIVRKLTNMPAALAEFKTILHTDALTTLLAGYLIFAGNLPVVLFFVTLLLYIVTICYKENESTCSSIKPVAVINDIEQTASVIQTIKLLGTISEPIPLVTEHTNAENILAYSMAELIRSGYSVIPQTIELSSLVLQEYPSYSTIPLLISSDRELLKKLPSLIKKYYVLLHYNHSAISTTINKIAILGSLERAGKNSFTVFAPLIKAFAQSSKAEIVNMYALGTLATGGSIKNPDTDIKYSYISRNDLSTLHDKIPQQTAVIILCDDSPGWPPADYRVPDILSEHAPCILAFTKSESHTKIITQYPYIVDACIKNNRVVSFGSDSAIADAIKALLLEIFKNYPKEAEHMAAIFYPKAFQEPIMLDSGIMLLHARNKKLQEPELAIAINKKGWQHLALKQPVHCILMLLSPDAISAQEHLDNLASLVHAIRDMNLIQNIVAKTTDKTIQF